MMKFPFTDFSECLKISLKVFCLKLKTTFKDICSFRKAISPMEVEVSVRYVLRKQKSRERGLMNYTPTIIPLVPIHLNKIDLKKKGFPKIWHKMYQRS